MSVSFTCSHTFQWNGRGCTGITWRSFFVSFKCQLSLWRLVKHKMTVSPGHALLSSNIRPPDVLWLQFTGCSLSGGQCSRFFCCLFVLMHLVEKAGASVLIWLERGASFSKTLILLFPILSSALEKNGSLFPSCGHQRHGPALLSFVPGVCIEAWMYSTS